MFGQVKYIMTVNFEIPCGYRPSYETLNYIVQ